MSVEITKFKGYNILKLTDENSMYDTSISFGVGKAKLILNHIDEIREFVEEADKRKKYDKR